MRFVRVALVGYGIGTSIPCLSGHGRLVVNTSELCFIAWLAEGLQIEPKSREALTVRKQNHKKVCVGGGGRDN